MAYIYQVGFDIRPDQMSELQIGASLERVLAYLRALLPSGVGYITARAMYSVDVPDRTHLVFQSVWEDWEDLENHRGASIAEDKVLTEFKPHVELQDLTVRVYEEVS
jgi:quinol monooxygenase YgiN